ncbi:MAG TPA: SGNH/GDSL hydrolase family protein [Pseudonocardia sp.]
MALDGLLGLASPVRPAPSPAAVRHALESEPLGVRNSTGDGAGARPAPSPEPLLVVVGASFAAGAGVVRAEDSWPFRLARAQGWRVVVSATPGAGFISSGAHAMGPLSRLAARLDLARLHPSLIIVQGGHNDLGRPPADVAARVTDLVLTLRRAAPGARLVVLSVFSGSRGPSATALTLDHAIVTAARSADPSVLVVDPLAQRWTFPRVADQLHPSAAGHAWIAARLARDLDEATPAPDAVPTSMIGPATAPGRLAGPPSDPPASSVAPGHAAALTRPGPEVTGTREPG